MIGCAEGPPVPRKRGLQSIRKTGPGIFALLESRCAPRMQQIVQYTILLDFAREVRLFALDEGIKPAEGRNRHQVIKKLQPALHNGRARTAPTDRPELSEISRKYFLLASRFCQDRQRQRPPRGVTVLRLANGIDDRSHQDVAVRLLLLAPIDDRLLSQRRERRTGVDAITCPPPTTLQR